MTDAATPPTPPDDPAARTPPGSGIGGGGIAPAGDTAGAGDTAEAGVPAGGTAAPAGGTAAAGGTRAGATAPAGAAGHPEAPASPPAGSGAAAPEDTAHGRPVPDAADGRPRAASGRRARVEPQAAAGATGPAASGGAAAANTGPAADSAPSASGPVARVGPHAATGPAASGGAAARASASEAPGSAPQAIGAGAAASGGAAAAVPAAPPVYVIMAVFRPEPAHLAAQMASLAAQSHAPALLIAVIADMASGGLVREAAARAGLALALVETGMELDAVRAFEAGLAEAVLRAEAAPAEAPEPLLALCDQDDIWHPERLARGVAALAGSAAQLVHSDARLVGPDGVTVLAASVFAVERRHRRPGLRGLLYRNAITGMTALMRLRVARLALPFPPQSGVHYYHDLWLGLLAAATGGVARIDAALVDYRQHGANVMGAVDRSGAMAAAAAGRTSLGATSGRSSLGAAAGRSSLGAASGRSSLGAASGRDGWRGRAARRLPDAMWLRREAAAYGLARYLAQSVQNRLADAVADGRLAHGQARTAPLRAYLGRGRGAGTHLADAARLALTGHAGLARIAAGFAVVSLGRTVWTLRRALGEGRDAAVDAFDTRLYSLSPGVSPRPPRAADAARPGRRPVPWQGLADARKTPRWRPAFTAPEPSVTVLVPTLNPAEIFAGIVTALDIGLGLAARGRTVRFVATDLPVSSPGAARGFLLRRLGTADPATAGRVSLHCGISEPEIPAHRGDTFLATAWWTAHIAQGLIRDHGFARSRFWYLIQDYEPNFYAWGPEFADAMASYDFAFEPLFNTTLLRDHFAAQGFGFATPDAPAFRPAIDIARYADQPRAPATPRRLALYGRPEVPRNMYATAIEALARFVETEAIAADAIELVSIGLAHAPVALPGGHVLKSLGKLPYEDYPAFLAATELGLSLMYSPHPSHPPLEMAAAGMRVVTNRFGPKDLATLSPAIQSVPPTPDALARALARAWHAPHPLQDTARHIDLTPLGQTLQSLLNKLAEDLR